MMQFNHTSKNCFLTVFFSFLLPVESVTKFLFSYLIVHVGKERKRYAKTQIQHLTREEVFPQNWFRWFLAVLVLVLFGCKSVLPCSLWVLEDSHGLMVPALRTLSSLKKLNEKDLFNFFCKSKTLWFLVLTKLFLTMTSTNLQLKNHYYEALYYIFFSISKKED